MKIIVDAMGGDHAPESTVKGAVQAAREYGCEIILVGRENEINAILASESGIDGKISVVNATEVIEMDDGAAFAFREKKDSSMTVALNMLASGAGDALVSAGSTGALLSGAIFIVKRVKGIKRAAIAATIPTKNGYAVIADGGANVDCSVENLMQFAEMGSFYAEHVLGIKSPRVGLINNGAEESKGCELAKNAYVKLKQAGDSGKINFVGNIEGRGVPYGEADVYVCDGFVGNVMIKTFEGVALYLAGEIKSMFLKNIATKLAALVMNKGIKQFKNKMDYKQVGGAPLLGVQKAVIKAHGSSDATAIKNAVRQALSFAESGVCELIAQNVAQDD